MSHHIKSVLFIIPKITNTSLNRLYSEQDPLSSEPGEGRRERTSFKKKKDFNMKTMNKVIKLITEEDPLQDRQTGSRCHNNRITVYRSHQQNI